MVVLDAVDGTTRVDNYLWNEVALTGKEGFCGQTDLSSNPGSALSW